MSRAISILAVVTVVAVGHHEVHAQPPPPPPLPPPPLPGGASATPAGGAPANWIGVGLVLIPIGTLTFEADGMSESDTMEPAYGLEFLATHAVSRNLSIVVAPRFLMNITGSPDSDSATQLDLRIGVSRGIPVPPSLYLYVYGALGYSIIFPPDLRDTSYRPAGLVLALGAGAGYLLGPRLMATASIGYQLGAQGTTVDGIDVTLKDDLLDVTAGFMIPID